MEGIRRIKGAGKDALQPICYRRKMKATDTAAQVRQGL